jgi:polysaccharide biosynthesis protein PslH
MNILFLCNKSPYPAKEGGPIAMNMMIEGVINAGHKVKVLAVNSNKYSVDISSIPEDYKARTGIEFVQLDLRVKPFPAFLNLFSSRSLHIERFISPAFEKKLEEILKKEKFDIVQFEMIHMSPYIGVVRKCSKAKLILRAHNIEHIIWERIAKNTKDIFKKIYLIHLARTLKKYELSVINDFDGIIAITNNDALVFRDAIAGRQERLIPDERRISAGQVISIPFGIDLSKFPVSDSECDFPSLFSIGSMDWNPNSEGIYWFLEKVWPEVHQKFPTLKYYIAGRNMPEWLMNKDYPNVIVVGEVDSSLKFMQSMAIMIVPLLSGSGIRIKIIEGMAAGKAIISTTIGAEGINCINGQNIFLADQPSEFSDIISNVVENKNLCRQVGENARKLVEKEYQQKDLIRKMLAFYEKQGT